MHALAFVSREVALDEVAALDVLVPGVGDVFALFVLDGRVEGGVRIGAVRFVVVGVGTEEDGKTLGGLEVVGEAVLVLVLVVRVAGTGTVMIWNFISRHVFLEG